MRTLTTEDVYISPGLEIVAAPAWAFVIEFGFAYRIVEEAWVPLLEQVGSRRKAAADAKAAMWEQTLRDAAAGNEFAQFKVSLSVAWRRGARPKGLSPGFPDITAAVARQIQVCLACGSEFVRVGRVTACTNRCAKERRNLTRTRGEPKVVERAPRDCEHCGGRFFPPRSDARFCSGKCRVARHRALS